MKGPPRHFPDLSYPRTRTLAKRAARLWCQRRNTVEIAVALKVSEHQAMVLLRSAKRIGEL